MESNLDSRFMLAKTTLYSKGVSQPVVYSKLVLRRHLYRKAINREH